MIQTPPTIVALSTPSGEGALAVIRLSGDQAIQIADEIFKGKKLSEQKSHTVHYGNIVAEDKIIDEVVISLFKGPHSYTGEHVVEISCHGSPFIIQSILSLCLQGGAKLAKPGEFTQRAFMNGKMDLSQAEAVADVIASENESQHRIAFQQMRGGYSDKIKLLRQELIDFAALLELELDFSEEDVEFANRTKLMQTLTQSIGSIQQMIHSFKIGNVIKKGIPVAIIGKPNVGKSTLLNKLLQEEKAMVSDIAGTTRDFIEDTIQINGVTYRFIDTAGIRETSDTLESMGIERSFEKIKQASLILFVHDIQDGMKDIVEQVKSISFESWQKVIVILNKSDDLQNLCNAYDMEEAVSTLTQYPALEMSAKLDRNMDKLLKLIETTMGLSIKSNEVIVSNSRHVEALQTAHESLVLVKEGIEQQISGEFISIDMRAGLQALGAITGQITNEDILGSVFSRFCIGK